MYKSTGTKLLIFKRLNPAQGFYSTGDENMEEGLEEILGQGDGSHGTWDKGTVLMSQGNRLRNLPGGFLMDGRFVRGVSKIESRGNCIFVHHNPL
jgi:hypothetical protein